MKRFLSALLSFVMIFTSLVTALPVKAQDMPRVTPTKDKIIESEILPTQLILQIQ